MRAFIGALFCVMAVCSMSMAEDLFLTLEDGVSVLLHPNHTWDYEKADQQSTETGKPIILDDGSTIIINNNGTWRLVTDKKMAPGGKKTILQSVNAVGMAKRSTIEDARASAMETALKRLAKQFKDALPAQKIDELMLMDCVQKEEKDVETSEEKLDLWSVTVKLGMDEQAVQNVIYCLEKTENLNKE